MHPLEKEVLALCRDNGLFRPGDRLVVGVSGGPDSMALLHLLAGFVPQLGVTLVVAHVDHGLRPAAARAEEALVRGAAAALGLECRVAHFEVAAKAKAQGLSLEEAGRDLRYAFFEATALDHGANKIVVAHTADDQAEEILLRLIRGAGRKGLSGMTLLREGRIVRPFLATAKARILSYLRDREIAFAVDSSNSDRRYLRNKIRLDLLPYLAGINPNIKQTLRQTATILRDEEAFLEAHAGQAYAGLVREGMGQGGPSAEMVRARFNDQPLAIRRRVVEKMLIYLGMKPGYRQIDSLIALTAAPGCGQLHLSSGLRAVTEAGELHLSYPCGKRAGRGNLLAGGTPFGLLVPQPGRYVIPEIGRAVAVEIMAGVPTLAEMRGAAADFFDAGTLAFPLLLRNRLPGDRFHPLNSKGKKKVADFLSDLKVPAAERERVPIMISADQVVAVLGRRIDQGVMVTARTTTVLRVTMTPVGGQDVCQHNLLSSFRHDFSRNPGCCDALDPQLKSPPSSGD